MIRKPACISITPIQVQAGYFLLNFLFQISEQLRVEKVLNRNPQTIAELFDRGYSDAAVEQHIVEYGVTEFIGGHYGSFDRLAAKAVIEAKKTHPEVTLTLLLPYHPTERPMVAPEGFDGTCCPPDMKRVPRRVAIVRANRYLVDHVDYLIAYAWHPASNARELVEYATTCNKVYITQLYDRYHI